MYKREIIIKNDIKFPIDLKYEDIPFVLNYLLKTNSVSKVDRSLYNYLIHSKSEQTTTPVKNNDSSYKEQEVQIAPKTECKGNNHKVGAGNTGKWFETQEQAAAYFKTEIAKWGKQWENFEITDEEYHKNCPYGYEVWTCPQCQKWTVNFYYNK